MPIVSNFEVGTTSYTIQDDVSYAHAVTNKGSAFASGLYKITTNNEGHVTAATAVQKSDITALGIPGSATVLDSNDIHALDVVKNSYINERTIVNSSSITITDAKHENINKVIYEINPITPVSTITGVNKSKNLLNPDACTMDHYISASGVYTPSPGDLYTEAIDVEPGDTIYIYGTAGRSGNRRVHGYDATDTWVQQIIAISVTAETAFDSGAIIIPEGIYKLRLSFTALDSNVMIEKGSQTSYEEYYCYDIITNTFTALSSATLYVSGTSVNISNSDTLSHTITFPSSIYGVSIEIVNGTSITINKTWDYISSYNGETIGNEWYSSNGNDTISPSTGASVLYKLVTPVALTGYTASNTLPVLYENTNYIWFVINNSISHNIKELNYSKQDTLKYILPVAASNLLGGIKIGRGITMNEETADINIASTLQLGLVKIGSNINVDANGVISIPSFATTSNPAFTDSISMGRLNNSIIGINSVSLGINNTASDDCAVSIGKDNTSSGEYSITLGLRNRAVSEANIAIGKGNQSGGPGFIGCCTIGINNSANGSAAIALGDENAANGYSSFAEGHKTVANGKCSHSQGTFTQAQYYCENVSGAYNVYERPASWKSSVSYSVGDKVVDGKLRLFECIQDTTPGIAYSNDSYWSEVKKYLVTVGNGTDDDARSNAYTLDWNGNGRFNGNVYVGCNADSTGGSKLATESYVSNALLGAGSLPSVTSSDNGKILQVLNGDWAVGTLTTQTMVGATSNAAGIAGLVPAPATTDINKFLAGDGTYKSGGLPMVVLSYGNSTWNDFINAYNNNVIVYCRASSANDPSTGSQTRMAFMAYVNNSETPTEVEFQYYRSVSSHTSTQYCDQVFIYKLTSAGVWSVTSRYAGLREIVAGTGMGVSYSSNKATINSVIPASPTTDGTYTLQVTVTNGTPTYSWV